MLGCLVLTLYSFVFSSCRAIYVQGTYEEQISQMQREYQVKLRKARQMEMEMKQQLDALQAKVVEKQDVAGGTDAVSSSAVGGTVGDTNLAVPSNVEKVLRFKEEQISALDKDNHYYKHVNREMKRKLRSVLKKHTVATSETQALQARVLQLEALHARVVAENNSLQTRRQTHVRIARKHLQEVVPSPRRESSVGGGGSSSSRRDGGAAVLRLSGEGRQMLRASLNLSGMQGGHPTAHIGNSHSDSHNSYNQGNADNAVGGGEDPHTPPFGPVSGQHSTHSSRHASPFQSHIDPIPFRSSVDRTHDLQ